MVLGGGSIVIHKSGNSGNLVAEGFNSGNRSDFSLQENAADEWQIVLGAEDKGQSVLWGATAAPYFDVVVPGDYDGDGQPDLAVFRRANGRWYVKRNTDIDVIELQSGIGTDSTMPAAIVVRVKSDGTQSIEPVVQFDAAQKRFVAAPIDLGPDLGDATDHVFLALFGTGIRAGNKPPAITASIGGVKSQMVFARAAPHFVGVDEVNVLLPRSLIGSGDVDVVLTINGKAANVNGIKLK
jgi:hypothetical protein